MRKQLRKLFKNFRSGNDGEPEPSVTDQLHELILEKGEDAVEETLERLSRIYGSAPLVSRVLSENPTYFITAALKNKAILHNESGPLDDRTVELITIGVASALRCDHCLEVHLGRAFELGVTKEEALQAIMIAGVIAESSTWAIAFRKYRQVSAKREKGKGKEAEGP